MLISNDKEKKYLHFKQLKKKYGISSDSYIVSSLNPLYPILQKMEEHTCIAPEEFKWLHTEGLVSKEIWTACRDIQASCMGKQPEYIEKIMYSDKSGKNRQKNSDKSEEKLKRLKLKYEVHKAAFDRIKKNSSTLIPVLQKLERGKRLLSEEVVWLQENHLLKGRIAEAYHTNEAEHYEQIYERTDNIWNIVNASSHWRGAGRSKDAVRLTDCVNLPDIRKSKLKAALLTTRGGALRDIRESEQAEICALKAIFFQSEDYRPYNLMGAVHYDLRFFGEGDMWFEEAEKRGAPKHEADAELRRIVRRSNGKDRQQLIKHLLQKDPVRYSWAREELKNENKRKTGRRRKKKKKIR